MAAPLSPADVPRQAYASIPSNYVVSDSDCGRMLESMGGNVELAAAASIGTYVYIRRAGTGEVRIVPGQGSTLQSQGGLRTILAQWVMVTVDKRSATEWVLSGSLG